MELIDPLASPPCTPPGLMSPVDPADVALNFIKSAVIVEQSNQIPQQQQQQQQQQPANTYLLDDFTLDAALSSHIAPELQVDIIPPSHLQAVQAQLPNPTTLNTTALPLPPPTPAPTQATPAPPVIPAPLIDPTLFASLTSAAPSRTIDASVPMSVPVPLPVPISHQRTIRNISNGAGVNASALLRPLSGTGGQTRLATRATKPRTYQDATPSKHCHICSSRPSPASPHLICGNLRRGTCRKTVCEKCFLKHGWDVISARATGSSWICHHCRGVCPSAAQCFIYGRTTERRRKKASAERTAARANAAAARTVARARTSTTTTNATANATASAYAAKRAAMMALALPLPLPNTREWINDFLWEHSTTDINPMEITPLPTPAPTSTLTSAQATVPAQAPPPTPAPTIEHQAATMLSIDLQPADENVQIVNDNDAVSTSSAHNTLTAWSTVS